MIFSFEHDNFTLSDDINGPLLAAVISIEMIAGLITNSFVLILTLCHIKTWMKPSIVFLTNMLLNNLIIVLLVMPFSIVTCATGEWIFGNTMDQKIAICKFTGYLISYNFNVATDSLALLSFDRFFFIVKAYSYERYMSTKKALIIVAVSWLLAAALSSPPLFGFGEFELSHSFGFCIPTFGSNPALAVYCFMIFTIPIFIVIVTTVWTYCHTRRYLNERNARMMQNSKRTSYFSKEGSKVIGLFGMLIIVHIVCYALINVLVGIEPFVTPPDQLYAAGMVLLLLVTILTPLVQSCFRVEIRNFFGNFFKKINWKSATGTVTGPVTV